MFFVNYPFVSERLKITLREARKLLPHGSVASIVASDRVLALLNKSRRGAMRLEHIPADLMTPEEASSATGVPIKTLLRITRRKVRFAPHFRINKQVTRFREAELVAWLKEHA